MDFSLSYEQQLLRDSARRYFDVAHRAKDSLAELAEFGWLAMPVPEAAGGLGASLEDISLLCEEIGRARSDVPYVGAVLLPAALIESCVDADQAQALLALLVSGSERFAAAIYEPQRRYQLSADVSALTQADGGYRLSGRKCSVLGGADATRLIVSACIDGREQGLLILDADRPGVDRQIYASLDGSPLADYRFNEVRVDRHEWLMTGAEVMDVVDRALDRARVGLCAEVLGGVDRAIELTVEHLKIRRQFGRALAEFQVLQHSVAEMSIDAGSARSILYRAIAAFAGPSLQRREAVSACMLKLMQAAKSVTGSAIHLHGAIGFTCEMAVGHYLRRVVVAERLLGDREDHLARWLELKGAV